MEHAHPFNVCHCKPSGSYILRGHDCTLYLMEEENKYFPPVRDASGHVTVTFISSLKLKFFDSDRESL
jgi:hypothetical protein